MAIVAAILAVALWPSAMDVDLATVARGPMQVTIDEEGETRVRERFVVSAPVMTTTFGGNRLPPQRARISNPPIVGNRTSNSTTRKS